jgi:hypothetical protein
VLFINRLLGMPLHPGQIEYIEETTSLKTKVNVLVPANRYGKTTIIACLHIWTNFYKRGIPEGNRKAWARALYRTANVAPSSSLIEAGFNYIDQIMTSSFPIVLPSGRIVPNTCLIEWFYAKSKTRTSPVHLQFFANNSYVEHRTLGMSASDSLEGKPYGLITYDEGGRSRHLEAEVNGTLLARLFDWQGQLHIVGTPDQNSTSILYHFELYQKGLNRVQGYYTMEGQLKDNIFFPKEQIEEQYKLYEGNPLKDQVLYGKFVFGGDNLYNALDILEAKDETLNDGKRYQEGRQYVISSDTAIGADEMVHTVLDITDLTVKRVENAYILEGMASIVKQVACKGNSKSPQRHLNDFVDLYDSYRTDKYSPEYILETWNGESARFYLDLPDYIKVHTKCYGTWQPMRPQTDNHNKERPRTQAVKKSDVLLALGKFLAARVLRVPSVDPNPVMAISGDKPGADLVQQLTIYKEDDNNLPTDRLMSLALACWRAVQASASQKMVTFINW